MAKATKGAAPAKRRGTDDDIIDVGATLPGELPAVQEDAEFVVSAGQAVKTFLAGALVFFTRAAEIEEQALVTLTKAEALAKTPPKTEAEDRAIQNFILKTNADKRVAEDHWKITTLISGFHRRMTGGRKRATEPLERANLIGNNLHNAYVDAEKRRVERENREREEAAAREQQRIRDEELAELEREAVKAEERAPELSKREQAFVDAYMSTVTGWRENGRRAAEVAQFKKPLEDAARLLSLPKIQKAIKAKREAEALRDQREAVKQAPLDPVHIEEVRPNIAKASGAKSRTTHSADLLNERALVNAVLEGSLGIPSDILCVDQSKLNGYAESLQERINSWPGVRLKTKTVTF